MTGPVEFNPFLNVGGTQNIEEINDRRHGLRFPDMDVKPPDIEMNQGQDQEGEIDNLNLDMNLDKKPPIQ